MFDHITTGKYWDKPLTLVSGCTRCSPGCLHCWSLAMEHRFGKPSDVRFHPERLAIPIKRRIPTVYAVWNDLLHNDIDTRCVHDALRMMHGCPRHIFMILTKRAHLMREKLYIPSMQNGDGVIPGNGNGFVIPNVWLGITVCNQAEANEKIPWLIHTPAAVRYLSIEPALGPIDLTRVLFPTGVYENVLDTSVSDRARKIVGKLNGIDWVIFGGENGAGARMMDPDWARKMRDQCQKYNVPFYFKGFGSASKKLRGKRNLDWVQYDMLPWAAFEHMGIPHAKGW